MWVEQKKKAWPLLTSKAKELERIRETRVGGSRSISGRGNVATSATNEKRSIETYREEVGSVFSRKGDKKWGDSEKKRDIPVDSDGPKRKNSSEQ